jgi:hypothetical protein
VPRLPCLVYSRLTDHSNKQLNFLHDRMPVILDNGSEAIRTWLDPNRTEWSKDLQSLLKPYEGELECYPVSKEVGKVGNNSPSFVVPVNSAENKNNIANFFSNQRKAVKVKQEETLMDKTKCGLKDASVKGAKIEHDVNETRDTTNDVEGTENNAPLPIPAKPPPTDEDSEGLKRRHGEQEEYGDTADIVPQKRKISATTASPRKSPQKSPVKKAKTRSATSNGSAVKGSPTKGDGSRKITSFFGK